MHAAVQGQVLPVAGAGKNSGRAAELLSAVHSVHAPANSFIFLRSLWRFVLQGQRAQAAAGGGAERGAGSAGARARGY